MNESTTIHSNNSAQGELFHLTGIKNRKIEVSYTSPDTSSYGGLLLLREVEGQSSIIDKMTHVLEDTRHAGYICHSYKEMLTQRIMQIAIGYEDADDCDSLRHDSILKMCTGRLPESEALSSQPTMSRLENRITRSELYAMAENFVTAFISSYESAPESIILDIDDSNFNTYGDQQYTLFSNYYGENCYMPFFIFEGISGKLILPLLRPGRRSKHLNIFGVMRRIIELLRRHWKNTVIVIRGDSHFSCDRLMSYCEERENLYYITGMIGFNPLKTQATAYIEEAEQKYKKYKEPVRLYRSFFYGAESWKKKRRVIVCVSVCEKGTNVRFIITNFSTQTSSRHLYERVYSARGTMELYIKEIKTYLKGHRMSCSRFCANQFRLFLHGVAYTLMHTLRSSVLGNTSFKNVTMITLREKFLLVAVHVKTCKTKIKVELPVNYPHKEEFSQALLLFEYLRLTG